MPVERGAHRKDEGYMEIADRQPTIYVWMPDVISISYLVFVTAGRNTGVPPYDVISVGNGAYEIIPQSPLDPDNYCLVQGNALLSQSNLLGWCFTVEE